MLIKKLCLLIFIICCSFSSIQGEIERRAAFDLGSGSLKLLIADVETDTQTIIKYIFSRGIKVPLSEDLAKNNDRRFSEEIQQRVKMAMHELKLMAEERCAERYVGVATEAFRLAQNGEELLFTIGQNEGFNIRLINQKEEAELGFATAIAHSKGDPETAVVWDIGNGSFQVSWKNQNCISSYMKKLGKTPVKNLIISEIQGRFSSETTPNPISEDQANLAKFLLTKELGEIPESLQIKVNTHGTEVYGIGAVHNGNISTSSKQIKYTLEIVDALLAERMDLSDSAFAVEAPEFWVSDLILVSAVMSHLNIASVINIKAFDDPDVTTSGSTVGILVWPEYWPQKIKAS